MKYLSSAFVVSSLALTLTQPALAYVGPGAGLSLLGALWGVLLAVVAAVGFIILWPLRRAWRRAQARRSGVEGASTQAASEAGPSETGGEAGSVRNSHTS